MARYARRHGRFKRYGWLSRTRNWLAGYFQAGQPLSPDTIRTDIPFYRTRISAEHNSLVQFLPRWRATYDTLAKALRTSQEEIEKNERSCALAKGRAGHFENQKDQALATHLEQQDRLQRTVERWESQWKYWTLLSVVGLLDIPINFLSFQFGFSEYPVVSVVLAIIFGLIIATSAHGIGRSAKRFLIAFHKVEASNRSKQVRYLAATGYAFAFALLSTVMGMTLMRLGVLRQALLASMADSMPSDPSIFARQAAHTFVFGQTNITLDDRGWAMVFINAALLVLAAAAAFTNSDSDSQFERSLNQADAKQLIWENEAAKLNATLDARTHLYAKHRAERGVFDFIRTQPSVELNGRAKHVRMELGDYQRGSEFRGVKVPASLRNISLSDIEEDIIKRVDLDAMLPDISGTNDDEDTER